MPRAITPTQVLRKLDDHMRKCEMANEKTARALEGLVTTTASMAQAHRDLAASVDGIRTETRDSWATFNRRAWQVLGAVGLSVLAGIIGVIVNAVNTNDIALKSVQATQAAQGAQVAAKATQAAVAKQQSGTAP